MTDAIKGIEEVKPKLVPITVEGSKDEYLIPESDIQDFYNFSPQEYLPEEITGTTFYNPGKNAREEELRKYLKNLWKEKYGY